MKENGKRFVPCFIDGDLGAVISINLRFNWNFLFLCSEDSPKSQYFKKHFFFHNAILELDAFQMNVNFYKRFPHGTLKSHDFVFKLAKTIKAFKKILTVYHIRWSLFYASMLKKMKIGVLNRFCEGIKNLSSWSLVRFPKKRHAEVTL